MPSVSFGACTIDLDARQLFRDGRPVHMSPKGFELLRILVSERPRALSKAELHDRLWRGTFVTDDSLSRLVTEARAAIGDDSRRPVFLRTVHSFGYAFANAAEPPGVALQAACWLAIDGRAILLAQGENLIGRDPTGAIVLDSPRVSRRHARLTMRGSSAVLEDLGSRNGTSVNGARIAGDVTLVPGDRIGIGAFTLQFRSATDAPSTEAE